MNPKPTKGYVMPVKQGSYEKANAAVREYLRNFGLSDEDTERMMTDLIQRKVPFTRINHSWAKNIIESSEHDKGASVQKKIDKMRVKR